MTRNKLTVEIFMDGFRNTDRARILSCLTDDVQWEVPGAFSARGRDEFNQHIVSPGFVSNPQITVTRMTEENDVVVAEGMVETEQKDGTVLHLAFCDAFEMRDGKIKRLTSYLVRTN